MVRLLPSPARSCKLTTSHPTVDAIIFLAPISAFDQVLTEDHKVNRLEDSVLLWKAVCSNKLLANVDLVLFLNKCDLLERKLDAGVRLAKYVKSYGDRSNDLETASKCEWIFCSFYFGSLELCGCGLGSVQGVFFALCC